MPKLPRLKNPAEFNRAVNRIDEIFLENPGLDLEGDTPEARELDRISDLVIEYEDYFVHIDPPPPGGIIQVQLDQLELDESDLIPILGSRAVVSEVLHGKREVNLQMARALHEHLGIPAEDLLEANQFLRTVDPNPDPKDFPMSEMASAGWFGEGFDVKDWPGGAIEFLMRSAGITTTQHIANVAYRRNDDRRINAKVNPFALQAWCWRVLALTNQDDRTERVVEAQTCGALNGISADDVRRIALAYEPVWAIGTGLTATPEQAEAVHAFLRQVLTELYRDDVARAIRIQYGGSVKPDNAAALFAQDNIDGGLIGGASLEADAFAAIVKSAVRG